VTRYELENLGYDPFLARAFLSAAGKERFPTRVSVQFRKKFTLLGEGGAVEGKVTGRFHHDATGEADYPAVGDWVVTESIDREESCLIHEILPRRGVISRKMAGDRAREQIVAANVNTLFIVTGLDGDYNVPRIERYLTLATISGADPVVLLNKSDLVDDVDHRVAEVKQVAGGAPVYAMSALEGKGADIVLDHLGRGVTGVLVGSSGAGKSTLINCLLGEEVQPVHEVHRKTDRGVHTTTRREMILLDDRGILIDTPGLREVHLWADETLVSKSFEDLEALADQCRFRDCRHETEPGCAVIEAIESGSMERRRLENYRKLQAELRELAALRERQEQKGRRGSGGSSTKKKG
jgi:ribosome biogenesis GTPase